MRTRSCAVLSGFTVFLATLGGGITATGAVAQSSRAAEAAAEAAAAEASDGVAPTESAALAEARKSGERTEITAFRAERRTVYANPDSTFTAIQSVQPVRVFQGGRWAAPDPTLVRSPDGTIHPKAAAVAMRFSGGGTGEFAQMDRAGRKLSLSFPEKLPKPVLSANTATYQEVLPGVDLIVNAEVEGFSHVFQVKSAAAAKDPRVAKLELGLRTERIKARATADGGVDLVDAAAGGTVFEAPQPVMWDSRKPADPPASGPAGKAATSLDAANSVELREGPAESSRRAEVKVGLGKDKVVLTPDAALLSDPKTEFPVFIDPVYKTSTRSGWTMVSSGYPTTEYWGFPGKDNEGMGKCPQLAGDPYYCSGVGTKRLFYAIPTSAFKGKTILSAEFAVTLRHTYYNAGTNARAADLHYSSAGIGKSTNWNNQPTSGMTLLQTKSPTNPTSSCTSTNQNVRFNAKAAVQAGLSTTTFRLRADDEGDYTYWKRWCENAQLEVHYNTPPRTPVQSKLSMSPGGQCRTGTGRPYVDVGTPTLLANEGALTDPDHTSSHTEQLRAKFKVAWTPSGGTRVEKTLENGNKASGAKFSVALPSSWAIPENVVVTWQVQAADILDGSPLSWGPWSGACEFVVDKTSPKPPVISSVDYPDDTGNHDGVGVSGEFTFDSPSADVVEYRYGFNGDSVANNAVRPAAAGGPVTVRFTPQDAGPQWVDVDAVDNAGKTGSEHFEFKVAEGRQARAHWKLDEAPGADAVTATTSGIPVSFGPAVVPGSAGKIGQALNLNGWSNQAYGFTDTPIVRTEQSFTASVWVRLQSDTYVSSALAQDGVKQSGFQLGVDPGNGWAIRMPTSDGDNGGGPWMVARQGTPAPLNTWTHLTGVYDATAKQLRLYVNGQRVAVRDGVTGWNSQGALQIGRSLYDGAYYNGWKGDIDDVKLLQYAASDADAQQLAADQTPSAQPLLAHWALDEPAGVRRAYDQSTEVKAALTGGVTLGTEGRFGKAISVNGSAQYADTTSSIVDPTKSYALSAWAKPTANNRWGTVAGQDGSRMRPFRIEQMSSGNWAMSALPFDTDTDNPVVRVQSLQPVRAGEWTHLIGVYDAQTKNIKLYVNGQLQGTAAYDAAGWTSAHRGPFSIGSGIHQGAKRDYFMGEIDDVRLFDRVVVPQEAHDLFSTAPERKGYWPLNTAPNNLSPEQTGGQPLALTGDASIYVPSDPIFDEPALTGDGHLQLNVTGSNGAATTNSVVRTDGSYTVIVRARLASARPGRSMTALAQAGANRSAFRLRYNHEDDRWQVGLAQADTPDAEAIWLKYDQAEPSADASGQSLALVYDAFAGEARLYVDGEEIDTAIVPFRSAWNAAGQLQVGRGLLGTTPDEPFSGALDDVRVYSGVVGETTLQQLANPQELPDL